MQYSKIDIANMVIDELNGTTKVARGIGKSPQVVSNWKARGIPRPWLMVLKKEFPNLKTWELLDQEGGN